MMSGDTVRARMLRWFGLAPNRQADGDDSAAKQERAVGPMSDRDLARAIREFGSVPVSDGAIARLAELLAEPSREKDG